MSKNRVLIVDDMEDNLYLLRALLGGHGYEVTSALNGVEALDAARKDPPDLVVSDILMPVMDGFTLCREWKHDERLSSIPFVFYTATYTDEQDREFALSLGAERFVVKPAEPDAFIAMVEETIHKPETSSPTLADSAPRRPPYLEAPALDADDRAFLQNYNAALVRKLEAKMEQLERANRELEQDVAERIRTAAELAESAEQLRLALSGAIDALGATVELRDPYTAGHQRRVAQLACALATDLGWEESHIESLRKAALLHDVGKIKVPAEILSKPGRLNESEMSLIKQHAAAGADMVSMIDINGNLAEVIRQHHERLDHSGYPAGIGGDDVLPEARVIAVADVVEAMLSHRPYRPARTLEETAAEIRDGAGVKYDADVVASCLRVVVEQGFQFEQ